MDFNKIRLRDMITHSARYKILQSQCHGFLANLIDTKFSRLSKDLLGMYWNLLESKCLKIIIV